MIDERFSPPEKFATASDQLHDLVARVTGASDFGDGDYLWGLRILLQSMDYDPIFSEFGKKAAWGLLIGALSSRAYAIQSMAQNSGFDGHEIRKPIVITGIPRTGTTVLHKLMAVDPQFQGLQTWILNAPMPRPPRAQWESNPHFREAVAQLEARFAAMPGLRAAHNMAAEDVEECLWILRQSFLSNFWVSGWSAASYDAFWQTQSELPAYRHLRRVLQLIGSTEPDKRWLLKNPGHIANLDLLFEVFPDALVIQTHRDPAKAVPSLSALLVQNIASMETGRQDMRAHILCHREVEKWAKAVRDSEPVRQARAKQIMDVIHGDFHRNPIPVIRRIYAFLGLTLTPAVEAAMNERVAEAPESSHGEHRYDVGDFGLTEEEIRERFGNYVERFDLRPKKGSR
jgi:hypothetical protein